MQMDLVALIERWYFCPASSHLPRLQAAGDRRAN
jgi:hypothetical protein